MQKKERLNYKFPVYLKLDSFAMPCNDVAYSEA